MTKSLYLVDGNSLVYRAFYAVPPFKTKDGLSTNAVFGFVKMMIKLIKDRKPDYLAVVFDAHGPTFRDAQFEQYKATRQKAPDELNMQRPYIHQFVELFGTKILEIQGVEADDVIGTLVKRHENDEDLQTYIVTGDKDLMQFVRDDKVMLYDTMKNVVYNEKAVEEKMGVPPNCIIDLLALMGDTSDNIPGVKGIGPKTATKLLQEYKSFAGIYEHVDEITGSSGDKLRDCKEMADLSYLLATIKTDVELDIGIEDLKSKEPQFEALQQLFEALEFKTLYRELENLFASKIPQGGSDSPSEARENRMGVSDKSKTDLSEIAAVFETDTSTIKIPIEPLSDSIELITQAKIHEFFNKAKSQKQFAYRIEADSEEPMKARVRSLFLSLDETESYRIDFSLHTELDKQAILATLLDLINSKEIVAIGFNIKFDLHVLANELGEIQPTIEKHTQQSLL